MIIFLLGIIILNIALMLPSSLTKKAGIFLINLANDIEKGNKNG